MSHGIKFPPPPPAHERLLTPSEVAALFRVDPKTVTRWAKAGRISSLRTLGGHRRYRESEVRGLLADGESRQVRMYDVKPGDRIRWKGVVVLVAEIEPLGEGMLRLHLGLSGRSVDVHGNSLADIVAPDAGVR